MRKQRRHERLGSLADLRDLNLKLPFCGLHPARAIAISEPRLVVAKPALILRPALIARSAQPRLELVLDSPLNDQPGTELRELRQRLSGVLADPDGEQLVDLVFYLRRRRYGTSHGVGLLLRLAGLEGTYAVTLTALGAIYSSWGTSTFAISDGGWGGISALLAAEEHRRLPRTRG